MSKMCQWPMSLEEFIQTHNTLKKKLQKSNNIFVLALFGIFLGSLLLLKSLPNFFDKNPAITYSCVALVFVYLFGVIFFMNRFCKKLIKKMGWLCPKCGELLANEFRLRLIASTGNCSNCGYKLIIREEGETSLSEADFMPSQTRKKTGKVEYVKGILMVTLLAVCLTTQIALILGGIMFFKVYPIAPQWLNFIFTNSLALVISFFIPAGIYFKLSHDKQALRKQLRQKEMELNP